MRQVKRVKKSRRKRCRCCHHLFNPDPRSKDRQKFCSKTQCQNARQRQNEYDWRQRNPECLSYQKEQSHQWHKARPAYSQQRRAANPGIERKNRQDTRIRMQNMRRRVLFDKSKSILTQLAGGNTDKLFLARGRWLTLRLTKASPLSKAALVRHNWGKLKRVANQLPQGKLFNLTGMLKGASDHG
jgi:hypothetical protein